MAALGQRPEAARAFEHQGRRRDRAQRRGRFGQHHRCASDGTQASERGEQAFLPHEIRHRLRQGSVDDAAHPAGDRPYPQGRGLIAFGVFQPADAQATVRGPEEILFPRLAGKQKEIAEKRVLPAHRLAGGLETSLGSLGLVERRGRRLAFDDEIEGSFARALEIKGQGEAGGSAVVTQVELAVEDLDVAMAAEKAWAFRRLRQAIVASGESSIGTAVVGSAASSVGPEWVEALCEALCRARCRIASKSRSASRRAEAAA